MLFQVGKQDGQIESDVSSRIVKSFGEFEVVDLSVVLNNAVRVLLSLKLTLTSVHIMRYLNVVDSESSFHYLRYLFDGVHFLRFHRSLEFFRTDPSVLVSIEVLEGLRCC